MLRLILDRGADVAVPTESMYLVDMARVRHRYGDLGTDAEFDRLAGDVWRHPKVREWLLAEGPPQREGRTGEAAYRAAMAAPFQAYARMHGKHAWGDKTPYYVRHMGEVRHVFPDARVVNLVRDGRDVALSLLRVPFGPGNFWGAAHMWRDAVDAGDRAAAELGDDMLTIRYEDLVTDPEAVVPQVCAFLELQYEPAMLAIEESPAGRIATGQESWFTEIRRGIGPRSVGNWRRQMARSDVALFDEIAAAQLERHGYITELGSTRPRIPDTAYLAHNWGVKLWQFGVLHVWQERGREVPYIMRRTLRR